MVGEQDLGVAGNGSVAVLVDVVKSSHGGLLGIVGKRLVRERGRESKRAVRGVPEM